MEIIVIPGLTSEELANKDLERGSSICISPYDRTVDVVIKIKEQRCPTK